MVASRSSQIYSWLEPEAQGFASLHGSAITAVSQRPAILRPFANRSCRTTTWAFEGKSARRPPCADDDAGSTCWSAGIGPGVTFGELALLTDKPRSATIVADEDVVCHALSTADFRALARARPDVVIRLLLNLSRETANRLEFTSEEVVALEK